jgi:hypothetical protein
LYLKISNIFKVKKVKKEIYLQQIKKLKGEKISYSYNIEKIEITWFPTGVHKN